MGEGIFHTAMVWWVIEKTGSGTLVGLIMSITFLPAVILGPLAGTLADRLYPKILLIGSDAARAFLMIFFTWMAFSGTMLPNHLFILCGLLSAAGVFNSPTTMATIPRVVPGDRMEEAMALHTIVRDLSKLIGPAVGGIIIAHYSVGHAFAVNVLCLVFSIICEVLMDVGEKPPGDADETIWHQLKAGLGYVRRSPVLFQLLMAIGFLNLFVVPVLVLIPLSIESVFSIVLPGTEETAVSLLWFSINGGEALGVSQTSLALGSVLAGLFFARLFRKVPTNKLLLGVLLFNALLFGVFGVNSSFLVFVIGLLLLGGCFTAVNVAVLTLFQKVVDPEMKGRFFALVEVISSVFFPIALAATGFLSDRYGVSFCYLVCAAGIVFISLRLATIRELATISSASHLDEKRP